MKNATLLALLVSAICVFAHGQAQEKVLWSFGSAPNDGAGPKGAVISDSSGDLFGTTFSGGTNGFGTLFELSPQSDGTWTEAILYNFCSDFVDALCLDGANPLGALTFDSQGNLFGAAGGGSSRACGSGGSACGVVFELSPPSAPGGAWTESVLYNFCSLTDCADGLLPNGGLVFDANRNLYGTTGGGGSHGKPGFPGGTVFELSSGAGAWTETVLYSFCTKGSSNFCPDGAAPYAGVVFGPGGSLYGTTSEGGGKVRNAMGVVYQLSPGAGGWTEKVLISEYVASSFAPVTISAAGNLFGTTQASVFELIARKQASRSVLFTSETGTNPQAGVLIDGHREALFGTASQGGIEAGGTVWEITPPRQLAAIYKFCSLANCTDGGDPQAGLIEDQSGNLYGTTYVGGAHNAGVVFEVTP